MTVQCQKYDSTVCEGSRKACGMQYIAEQNIKKAVTALVKWVSSVAIASACHCCCERGCSMTAKAVVPLHSSNIVLDECE